MMPSVLAKSPTWLNRLSGGYDDSQPWQARQQLGTAMDSESKPVATSAEGTPRKVAPHTPSELRRVLQRIDSTSIRNRLVAFERHPFV